MTVLSTTKTNRDLCCMTGLGTTPVIRVICLGIYHCTAGIPLEHSVPLVPVKDGYAATQDVHAFPAIQLKGRNYDLEKTNTVTLNQGHRIS